jgi:hypothetical protein
MAIALNFPTQDWSTAVVIRRGKSHALTELLVLGCGHLRHSPSLSFAPTESYSKAPCLVQAMSQRRPFSVRYVNVEALDRPEGCG